MCNNDQESTLCAHSKRCDSGLAHPEFDVSMHAADFQKRRGARLQPLDAPRQLPAPTDGLDAGAVPSAEELRAAAAAVDTDL